MAGHKKRLTLFERFSRGDDSILNADSSAERRLLEGLLLIYGTKTAMGAVGLSPEKWVIKLQASQFLPEQVPGSAGTVAGGSGFNVGSFAASLIPGGQTPAENLGGQVGVAIAARLRPDISGQSDPEGEDGAPDGVPVWDAAAAALIAGYALEKANQTGTMDAVADMTVGLAGAVGKAFETGLGSGASAAAGALPALIA